MQARMRDIATAAKASQHHCLLYWLPNGATRCCVGPLNISGVLTNQSINQSFVVQVDWKSEEPPARMVEMQTRHNDVLTMSEAVSSIGILPTRRNSSGLPIAALFGPCRCNKATKMRTNLLRSPSTTTMQRRPINHPCKQTTHSFFVGQSRRRMLGSGISEKVR